jgi:catechol 2,3-dioxygenase-like lactoylglutathione lyase family enzyme
MDQRLSLITLAVSDLPRSRAFFEGGLGWTPLTALDEICFYQLNGLALALFRRADLEADARRRIDGGFSGVALAVNQRSRDEVDAAYARALAGGASALRPPEPLPWGGYSGYFADLDGHVWELAHNPGCTIDDEGRTVFSAG